MKEINDWLIRFTNAWKTHNIDKVLDLFTSDVEYWETPFKKLDGFNEIRSEWEVIKNQSDILLSYNVFSIDEGRYAVKWNLKYTDNRINAVKMSRGVYLIKLNSANKCTYFFHCGESKI